MAAPATADPGEDESASGDLCETLTARYAKSPALQHRHLVAAAAAMRSILLDESLPLVPAAYFAAAISTIENTAAGGDQTAMPALVSFLSVVLPAVPSPEITPEKASEAAGVLNGVISSSGDGLPASTLQSLVKSFGALSKLSNLEDWDVVKLPLKTLVSFSTDKRPKVRKVAQLGIEELFRSIKDSRVLSKSSKMMLRFFDEFVPSATELAAVALKGDADVDTLYKNDHVKVFHMFNTVNLVSPYMCGKIQCNLLSRLIKLLSDHYSPVTRHALNALEVLSDNLREESILVDLQELLYFLLKCVPLSKKFPQEIKLSAARLLKFVMRMFHLLGRDLWFRNLSFVLEAISGQLNSGTDVAEQVSEIFVEIGDSFDTNVTSKVAAQSSNHHLESNLDWKAIEITCFTIDDILDKTSAISGKHVFVIISHLFSMLGGAACLLMKGILVKLATIETSAKESMPDAIREHLHNCIGSAIASMGAEEVLGLIPVAFCPEEMTLSNAWLIPLLRKYIKGATLKYFMDCIVPLTNSIREASAKVKESHVLQNLQSSHDALWTLLPAFCRYPTDACQNFGTFATLIISLFKERPLLIPTISIALTELVNQNKRVLDVNIDDEHTRPSFYTKELANRNIEAIAVNSLGLLKVLRDVIFNSTLEDRGCLKNVIGSLASITRKSKVKKFFNSSLRKYELKEFVLGDFIIESDKSEEKKCSHETQPEEVIQRRGILLEFVSSLVVGADEALVNLLFAYVKATIQGKAATITYCDPDLPRMWGCLEHWVSVKKCLIGLWEAADNVGQVEIYSALCKIFEEHPWFYSSRLDELMKLLVDLKANDDVISLKSRLSCFRFLLVYILKGKPEDNSEEAFLILNEIILTVKSSKHGAREAAYDALLMVVSDLKRSEREVSELCLARLFSMILAYLSGSSPHIMSGAVSALSLLIYNDPGLCFAMPDLMPSVFILFKSKALEVIKAVMGFMKVVVSCLPAKDLQKYVAEIMDGVLPWSYVSKNHIRAKVRIIMEIIIRKCGLKAVELIVPEKYLGFIRTIVEERRSSSGLKGVDTSEPASKPVESSMRRKREHQHVQMGLNSANNSKDPNITGNGKKRKHYGHSVFDASKRKKTKFTGKLGAGEQKFGIGAKGSGKPRRMLNGEKVDDRRKYHSTKEANVGRFAGSAKPEKHTFGKSRKRTRSS